MNNNDKPILGPSDFPKSATFGPTVKSDAERIKELEERIQTLEEGIIEAQRSHSWMLKSIRRGSDETSGGNYSNELQHAISSDEMLELLVLEM